MATTTLTPTSATAESPKLLKKAAGVGGERQSPSTPTQTSFGCREYSNGGRHWNGGANSCLPEHIKDLLKLAREKATDNYGRIIQTVRDDSNVSDRIYKSGEKAIATGETNYLCLQCSTR